GHDRRLGASAGDAAGQGARPRARLRRAGDLRALARERRVPRRPAAASRRRRSVPRGGRVGQRARLPRVARQSGAQRTRRAARALARGRGSGGRALRGGPLTDAGAAIRVATDVGGTFTDLVYFTTNPETGVQEVVTAKSATTPPDFERGVMDVLAKGDVPLEDVAFLAHGTTVVINAITERKGVVTGLITTEGFRDSLEIARGNRHDYFNLDYEKPAPFVPRYLRREVPERITNRRVVRRPLDLSGLPAILDDFRRQGVQAIAVCLLNAYADPTHEAAVLARVRELWPDVPVVASHQITREWREDERTSTTVLSAYVQPVAERYLSRLADGAREAGFAGQLYIMQSNCGVDSVEKTQHVPITMVESGPASGIWAAAELGNLIGDPNVLALDIGGTTAKCSLVVDGRVKIMTDYWIERTRANA